jgi:hypothetical protein
MAALLAHGGPMSTPARGIAKVHPDSGSGRATGEGGSSSDEAEAGAGAHDGDADAADVEGGKGFSSTYIGVSWHRASGRWHGQIRHCGKRISLGYFHTEVEAARAYDKVRGERSSLCE